MERRYHFQQMVVLQLEVIIRRMKSHPFLSSSRKLKPKSIKDCYIKAHSQKVVQQKVGKSLKHKVTQENFMNRTPVAYFLSSKIEKWDFINLQIICKAKDTANRTKWQARGSENMLTNLTSYWRVISNIQKELKKLDSKESVNSIKNGYRYK